jgi:hypothetical protein
MARLRIFLAGTAIGVFCFAATANAETETWYVLSPATGKCYSGKDLYVFNGTDKRARSIGSPGEARRTFQKLGHYKGTEPLSAASPERAVIVKGRFPGDGSDTALTYFRDLDRCEELTFKIG